MSPGARGRLWAAALVAFLACMGPAQAHSPFSRRIATVPHPETGTLEVHSVWGDGVLGSDPVMAAAVWRPPGGDGDLGPRDRLVALGPPQDEGEMVARCPELARCYVDHVGWSVRPAHTWRLDLSQGLPARRWDSEWGGCDYTARFDCPRIGGFVPAQRPWISLVALSSRAAVAGALTFGPLVGASLLLLWTAIRREADRGRRAGTVILAGIALVLSLAWTQVLLFVGDPVPLEPVTAVAALGAGLIIWSRWRPLSQADIAA